ncbi:MAG: hypothetical protein V1709_08590 [Planctomycetota bacterium]
MRALIKNDQMDFTGGIFTSLGDLIMPPNTAKKLQNARVDKGGFQKIPGTTLLNSTALSAAISSQHRIYQGTYEKLIATSGDGMYYWDATSKLFSILRSALTESKCWSYVSYNTITYAGSGFDTPVQMVLTSDVPVISDWQFAAVSDFAASDATAIGVSDAQAVVSDCQQFVVCRERIYGLINGTNPDRVYHCANENDALSDGGILKEVYGLAKPDVWGSNLYQAFPYESTDELVRGGAELNGLLVVFTNNTITTLDTSTTIWEKIIRERNIGCVNWRTIKPFAGGIIFLAKQGVYYFNGIQAFCISEDIKPQIDNISKTYIANCFAETTETQYRLHYTSVDGAGTTNDKCLIFDTSIGDIIKAVIKGGWTGEHTSTACSASYWGAGYSDTGDLYLGDYSGYVAKVDEDAKSFYEILNTDGSRTQGNPIEWIVDTRSIDFRELGGLEIGKLFEDLFSLWIPEANYEVIVYYSINNNPDWTEIGRVSLSYTGKARGDRDDTSIYRNFIIHPLKLENESGYLAGNFINFRFYNNDKGCACNCRGIITYASQELDERR